MTDDERLAAAVLSKKARAALTAVLVDGLTHAEAAREAGVTRWAFMKRLQRARKALRSVGIEAVAYRKARVRRQAHQFILMNNV